MKKYFLILLLSFSVFAQNGLIARQNFSFRPMAGCNTYIGGISGSYATAGALATKLGISVGSISNFTVVGSDIKCNIAGSYTIPSNCFYYESSLTYYRDEGDVVTNIGTNAFRDDGGSNMHVNKLQFNGITSLTGTTLIIGAPMNEVYLANCVSIANGSFQNTGSFRNNTYIYIPLCTSLGTTSGNNSVFATSLLSGSVIVCHPSLATNNAGGVDGDIADAIAQGATIRYKTNSTVPSSITDLSAGTSYNTAIQLNFTPPTGSTNAIDFYEVYVNGVYNGKFTGSVGYAIGLTASTSYTLTVKTVDVFYNKSVSNTVSASTSNYSYTDTDANAYISAASLTGVEQESAYKLIVDLKANSLYTKTQAIYPLKGTTSAQHKFNAKNPVDTDAGFRLTFAGTATFSNLGYEPSGTNGFANSHFIPSTSQSLNSNGITLVVGTNKPAAGSDVVDVGSYNSGTQHSLLVSKNNNTSYTRVAGFNSTNISLTGTNEAKGIFTGTKQSATVTDFFINGTQAGTVNSGGTLPTYNTYIGCMNLTGSPYGYTNQRIQMVIFHEGLSDSETTTLHSIIDLSESIAGRKTW